MTLDQSPEIVCKLAVYLVAATVEIYLLCFFSDWLISAVSWELYHSLDLMLDYLILLHNHIQSEGVASAVYEMDWYAADPRFKKMLLIIAVRAQQPVFLKATVFLDISMATMTMVSY